MPVVVITAEVEAEVMIAFEIFDSVESPAMFVATTVKVYRVEGFSPFTVISPAKSFANNVVSSPVFEITV